MSLHEETGKCPWCGTDPLYMAYHDDVWGRPVSDSQELFAKLCLDGQQAGLSWITILRKQQNYEEAFAGFDPQAIIQFNDDDVERLLQNPGIVRNRLKVNSIIKNARAYSALEESGTSFSHFLWKFLDGKPQINQYRLMSDVPASTEVSDAMSKSLKKIGFSFVGSTICYAFMQAVGMVNDHLVDCPSYAECVDEAKHFHL